MASSVARSLLRRYWWLLAAAGVAMLFLAAISTYWWVTRDRFGDEVRRIGGRYREELMDGRMQAFVKAIHGEPLTVYHFIELERSRADDAWLAAHREDIARQRNLCLDLRDTRITEDGLSALRGLENINVLVLSGTPVGDAAVDIIASLPNLVDVHIDGTGISDTALAGLSRSPHLCSLFLDRSQITEQGMAGLASCPILGSLLIHDADDACVLRLSSLSRLEYLQIRSGQLTAASLPTIKQMKQLQLLSLFGNSFSEAELSELRQALPGCTVQQIDWKTIEALREAERE